MMRTNLFRRAIALACVVVMAVACHKSDIGVGEQQQSVDYITASIGATSRVAFDQHRVTWDHLDVIYFARVADGKFDTDAGYIIYKIDPKTISPNGTEAHFVPFYAGELLSDKDTYVAFTGSESYDESEEYINVFGFGDSQSANGSTQHINNSWIMVSAPFEYVKGGRCDFLFRHLNSVVSLTISLEDGAAGECAIDQVRFSSPINSFGSDVNIDIEGGVSSYNRGFDSYLLAVNDGGANAATISATKSYTVNFQVWWDPAYTDVEGDFAVDIRTTDGALARTSFPAKVLTAGTYYTKECHFAKPQTNSAAQRDRATLCALYEAMGGDSWKNNLNWCSDKPMSSWRGVKCDEMTGEVVELSLRYNGLVAESIPTQIGDLKALRSLDLSQNAIGGAIPTSIGELTNLQELRLYQNRLVGAIPSEIGNLRKLELLFLHENSLDAIPSTIGEMDYLTELNLYRNDVVELPHELGDMRRIKSIDISYNALNDTIPESICQLTTLEELDMSNNQLRETIPSNIGNLAMLRNLDLGFNNLEGTLPPSMANLPSDVMVSIIHNPLMGVVVREVVDHPNFSSWTFVGCAGLLDEDGEILF